MESNFPHDPADVLRCLLIDNLSQGTDPDDEDDPKERLWPIHAKSEPADPDDCITVYKREGQFDGQDPHSGAVWEHIGWHIRVRSRTKESGWTKANSILAAICGPSAYWALVTIASTQGTLTHTYRVETVTPSRLPIGPMQEQGSNRFIHTLEGFTTIDPNP
jgi:hypothetical protein